MFPLHDRVRRRICVAGFILLCVLPTVAVLGWGAAWSLPGHVRAEARRIGRRLGMEVSLGHVEHLRPGAVRLGGVVLRDLEQPDAVLHCDEVEAELKTVADKTGISRRVLFLRSPGVEVDATRMADLGELARRLLRLRVGNDDVDVRWTAERIDFRHAGRVGPLTDARGGAHTVEGSTEAWMTFGVANQKLKRPARIRLVRNRQVGPAADWFLLDTGGAALSCELLGRAIPAMRSLGHDARFRGFLRAESTGDGWSGKIDSSSEDKSPSELLDVDLNNLVTDRFPHTLSGKGHVVVRWASFHKGRLEEVRGSVTSGQGKVSPTLLNAASEHLGLWQPRGPMADGDPISFDAMAFRFELRRGSLAVRSYHADSTVVMFAGQECYLCATGRNCPAVGLVKAMVPKGTPEVPVTQQVGWLLRHLPLPKAVSAAEALGHSRVATEESCPTQIR